MFQILKNPPEYTMQYSVQPGRKTKNEAHAHLLGNGQLHEFHANPSQNFTTYNSQSVWLGTQLTLPKSMVTTQYSYSKRCDTFCQDCTFLEACIPRNTRDAYD